MSFHLIQKVVILKLLASCKLWLRQTKDRISHHKEKRQLLRVVPPRLIESSSGSRLFDEFESGSKPRLKL
jgi:hypothetical protein